ncbi:hypothetical protein ANN_12049 [Periplaneta americana]|uniref:Uncharacterized protein n=1 Tax=Periplaneta americana TaxID=6978 RepID=A0ABQ8T6R0_PERAM|nr:hypothetical protein ANN_12049 [Periplaneta americana]
MAGLCEGGNEPPGSLKATYELSFKLSVVRFPAWAIEEIHLPSTGLDVCPLSYSVLCCFSGGPYRADHTTRENHNVSLSNVGQNIPSTLHWIPYLLIRSLLRPARVECFRGRRAGIRIDPYMPSESHAIAVKACTDQLVRQHRTRLSLPNTWNPLLEHRNYRLLFCRPPSSADLSNMQLANAGEARDVHFNLYCIGFLCGSRCTGQINTLWTTRWALVTVY